MVARFGIILVTRKLPFTCRTIFIPSLPERKMPVGAEHCAGRVGCGSYGNVVPVVIVDGGVRNRGQEPASEINIFHGGSGRDAIYRVFGNASPIKCDVV